MVLAAYADDRQPRSEVLPARLQELIAGGVAISIPIHWSHYPSVPVNSRRAIIPARPWQVGRDCAIASTAVDTLGLSARTDVTLGNDLTLIGHGQDVVRQCGQVMLVT